MHVTMKHSNTNTHFCHICPASFPTQTQLAHHFVKHTDATIKCVDSKCKLVFKTTTTQKTHYVRVHMNKTELFKRLRKDTDSCLCFSCGEIFTLNAVVYHVSGCSPSSPFYKAGAIGVPVVLQPETKEMVLNQADADILSSFQGLEDIPDDIYQEIVPNQADAFDIFQEIVPNQADADILQKFEDIPDDICQELLDLYST
jgi:hypothetical protein